MKIFILAFSFSYYHDLYLRKNSLFLQIPRNFLKENSKNRTHVQILFFPEKNFSMKTNTFFGNSFLLFSTFSFRKWNTFSHGNTFSQFFSCFLENVTTFLCNLFFSFKMFYYTVIVRFNHLTFNATIISQSTTKTIFINF